MTCLLLTVSNQTVNYINVSSGQLTRSFFVARSRQTLYKCKKCRTTLAASENVLPHWPQGSITWPQLLHKMNSDSANVTNCKNGIFLEPLDWMEVCNSVSESRLFCAKCGSKLGTYAWDSAVKCPCGASMAPGFMVNLNRVDKCTMFKDIEAVI